MILVFDGCPYAAMISFWENMPADFIATIAPSGSRVSNLDKDWRIIANNCNCLSALFQSGRCNGSMFIISTFHSLRSKQTRQAGKGMGAEE